MALKRDFSKAKSIQVKYAIPAAASIVVQEGDATISSACSTLDFDSSDFNLSESPVGEVNVTVNDGGIDHGGLAGLSDDDHLQYLLANGTRALTANWDAGSFQVRAETFQSDVATGTAPLTVASTTLVTNLNANYLQGKVTGTSGNTIPLLDGTNTWSANQRFDGNIGHFAGASATSGYYQSRTVSTATGSEYGINVLVNRPSVARTDGNSDIAMFFSAYCGAASTGSAIGIYGEANNTGTSTATWGQAAQAWVNTSDSAGGTFTNARGYFIGIQAKGNAITTAYGFQSYSTKGLGSITTHYNFYANASVATTGYGVYVEPNSNAGTKNVGLYIGAQSGATNNQGIFVDNATGGSDGYCNYIGGNSASYEALRVNQANTSGPTIVLQGNGTDLLTHGANGDLDIVVTRSGSAGGNGFAIRSSADTSQAWMLRLHSTNTNLCLDRNKTANWSNVLTINRDNGDHTYADAVDFAFGTTTGSQIGTATTQKIGFWGVTPVVQQAHIADPSGGLTVDAEARTAINAINAMLAATGLTAAA